MKRKLCFMVLLCLFTSAFCQSQKAPVFTVGDKAPDLMVYNILNHPTGKAQLSSYRGKLLILDFMATWCSLCASLLPQTDSLQKLVGDEVQFLPSVYFPPVTIYEHLLLR